LRFLHPQSCWLRGRLPSINKEMLRLFGRIAFTACVLLLTCCGGPSAETPLSGGAGGSAAGASGAATVAQGGSTGGSTGGASLGGSGGQALAVSSGGAMACTSYVDAKGYTLTVHLKNASSTTLYLGPQTSTCAGERLFQVQDGARNVLPPLDACHTSCQALMQTGPVACPLACATPSTITLAPGQTVDVPWDGRYAVPQTLPQACMPSGSTGPNSCVQAQQIEAAAFTFVAEAGTRRQCLDASGTCTCAASANGTCTSASSVISGTIITSELLVKLEPSETSPGGTPPYIALEFKDVAK